MNTHPRKNQLLGGSGAFLVAALLYVLSVGPVIAFGSRLNIPLQSLDIVYAPLAWLHDNTPLEKPLEKYVALWLDSFPSGTSTCCGT